jgi:hypothetical protein
MKMEQFSETSAHKIKTPENHLKERVQHLPYGASLNASMTFYHHWSHDINA